MENGGKKRREQGEEKKLERSREIEPCNGAESRKMAKIRN